MGDGDGEGVGGIWAGDLGAGEQALDHEMDLRLFGIAAADHRFLDQAGSIFADEHAGAGGNGENDAAGLAELEGRLRVLVDEHLLDGGGVGPVLGDQRFELAGEVGEPFWEGCGGLRLQLAIGEVGQAVALGGD